MPITILPDTPLNEVRLNIGDDDGSLIDDAVITYLLTENDDNVLLVSVKAIDYIIRNAANQLADERTDEVSKKWSQIYDNLLGLREDLQIELVGASGGSLYFVGGALKSENETYYNDPDTVKCPVRRGDNTTLPSHFVSDNDPYSFT